MLRLSVALFWLKQNKFSLHGFAEEKQVSVNLMLAHSPRVGYYRGRI